MVGNTRDRGQTTLDFAAGVSVFLVTVIFVFAFVPSLLAPVSSGQPSNTVVADRIATDLAQEELAVEGHPYTLDGPIDDQDQRLENARGNISVPPGTFVNLTLRNADMDTGPPVPSNGSTPGENTATAVAWRVVTAPNGTSYELRVIVW
ncbi:DUF7287 family protein [Halarchaeum salinum]|uniref:Flagellin n=1 Tax=Halarchaeum salinum TaxID=489912 RepID=A0AAV3SAC3_9EURY